jgi:hypothetical protein
LESFKLTAFLDTSGAGRSSLQKLFCTAETPEPEPSSAYRFSGANSISTLLFIPRMGKVYLKMSMKLYVGNLAFQTTSEDLENLFSQAGTVQSANVIEDRETGRSRGFGFVEMSSTEEGNEAIEQFNGKEVSGRNLNVNEARQREERGSSNGGGRNNRW